jgi:hypothetical protein
MTKVLEAWELERSNSATTALTSDHPARLGLTV